MHLRVALFLLVVCLATCSLPDGSEDLQQRTEGLDRAQDPAGRQDLVRATSAQDAFTAIARLEDARSDGDGLLALLAGHSDARVRAHATTALGRLPLWRYSSEVTEALVHALDDEVPDVRRSAAFALGMRGDPAAESGLLAHRSDPDELVRARIVEAASKVHTPALQRLVLDALLDPAPAVRIEAAQGPTRFPAEVPAGTPGATEVVGPPSAAEVDGALIDFVAGSGGSGSRTKEAAHIPSPRPAAAEEAEWRAMASLSRRKSPTARDLFLDSASGIGDSRWTRFFALKGLSELVPASAAKPPQATSDREDYALRMVLDPCANDPDWMIACEAVKALGRLGAARSLDAVARAAKHSSAHVRAAAVDALAALPLELAPVAALLDSARADPSRSVRAAAIVGQAKFRREEMRDELAALAEDPDPLVRRASALGASELPSEAAVSLLLAATHDPSPFVSTAAVGALTRHAEHPGARARLLELLVGEDNGLRLASAEVLKEERVIVPWGRLSEAWMRSTGDIGSEARVALLRLADVQPPGDEQSAYLLEGISDPDPYLRRIAHELATARGSEVQLPTNVEPAARDTLVAPHGAPSQVRNPRVQVVTTRGTLEFELFPAEAPRHVASFLELAKRDHYDGLTFHRVVPGFVVQGGCYRGDGNGGGSSRGPALRHEIGPRKYTRGTLGMPRNDDPESGGSQFFVTHVPTPHLDGRYTVFGELRSGFEVLDTLEVGDRILDVH